MPEILLPTKTYNPTKLHEELMASLTSAKFNGVLGRKGIYYADCKDTLTANDETTIATIANAHDHTQLTSKQVENNAIGIIRQQIISYMKAQLTSATPDSAATIKTTLQGYVNGNTKLQNAITNMATLKSYNTGTNAGYIAAVSDCVAYMLFES